VKKFVAGVIVGLCVPFVAGYLFLVLGGMPVATKSRPLPLEKFAAKTALKAAIGGEVARPSPLPADEPNLLAGARIYQAQCAICHGRLGRRISTIAQGMFPRAPQLLPPKKGVTDDPVGETYWKAKHGIRLTGMPGFGDGLSDSELWQVSLLLRNADKLPAAVQELLREDPDRP